MTDRNNSSSFGCFGESVSGNGSKTIVSEDSNVPSEVLYIVLSAAIVSYLFLVKY